MRLSKRSLSVFLGLITACAALYGVYSARQGGLPGREDFTLAVDRAYQVENKSAGPLYVIEGRVTNNLGVPRCRIKIKASLLDQKGIPVAYMEAEAGIGPSISELKFLGWEDILSRMSPGPEACKATELQGGATGSFMVVFRNPPAQAASYAVRAIEASTP